ncbi:MAG TPA: hypothetical protein VF323_03355 [Candidatus Limnocylindrales bacterium]
MRRLIVLSVLALGLGACSPAAAPSATPGTSPSPTGAPPSPSAEPSSTPSASPSGLANVVFRVAHAGGFIAPSAELATLPDISIYDDGTVVMPGPARTADPGPAVPDLQVARVSAAGLASIMTAAGAAGLTDPAASFDGGPAPDAGVTVITIDLGGAVRHVRIVSLGDDTRDSGLDPKVVAARVKLRAFLAGLTDLRKLLGADLVAGPAPYVADSLRLIVNPGAPGIGGGNTLAWPLATGLAAFGVEITSASGGPIAGTGVGPMAAGLNGGGGAARCGVVKGADLATLAPLLARATTLTTWTSDGQAWTMVVRPLLPDETGCPGS